LKTAAVSKSADAGAHLYVSESAGNRRDPGSRRTSASRGRTDQRVIDYQILSIHALTRAKFPPPDGREAWHRVQGKLRANASEGIVWRGQLRKRAGSWFRTWPSIRATDVNPETQFGTGDPHDAQREVIGVLDLKAELIFYRGYVRLSILGRISLSMENERLYSIGRATRRDWRDCSAKRIQGALLRLCRRRLRLEMPPGIFPRGSVRRPLRVLRYGPQQLECAGRRAGRERPRRSMDGGHRYHAESGPTEIAAAEMLKQ